MTDDPYGQEALEPPGSESSVGGSCSEVHTINFQLVIFAICLDIGKIGILWLSTRIVIRGCLVSAPPVSPTSMPWFFWILLESESKIYSCKSSWHFYPRKWIYIHQQFLWLSTPQTNTVNTYYTLSIPANCIQIYFPGSSSSLYLGHSQIKYIGGLQISQNDLTLKGLQYTLPLDSLLL